MSIRQKKDLLFDVFLSLKNLELTDALEKCIRIKYQTFKVNNEFKPKIILNKIKKMERSDGRILYWNYINYTELISPF